MLQWMVSGLDFLWSEVISGRMVFDNEKTMIVMNRFLFIKLDDSCNLTDIEDNSFE